MVFDEWVFMDCVFKKIICLNFFRFFIFNYMIVDYYYFGVFVLRKVLRGQINCLIVVGSFIFVVCVIVLKCEMDLVYWSLY